MIAIYWTTVQSMATGSNKLIGPILKSFKSQEKPVPSPSPNIKTPVEFKFDSMTDLNAELDKVNPQVSDQDFPQ